MPIYCVVWWDIATLFCFIPRIQELTTVYFLQQLAAMTTKHSLKTVKIYTLSVHLSIIGITTRYLGSFVSPLQVINIYTVKVALLKQPKRLMDPESGIFSDNVFFNEVCTITFWKTFSLRESLKAETHERSASATDLFLELASLYFTSLIQWSKTRE